MSIAAHRIRGQVQDFNPWERGRGVEGGKHINILLPINCEITKKAFSSEALNVSM